MRAGSPRRLGLRPHDDDRTALILGAAGRWLAQDSPEEANVFYRSPVVRWPRTELGQKAQAARWFGRLRPGAN